MSDQATAKPRKWKWQTGAIWAGVVGIGLGWTGWFLIALKLLLWSVLIGAVLLSGALAYCYFYDAELKAKAADWKFTGASSIGSALAALGLGLVLWVLPAGGGTQSTAPAPAPPLREVLAAQVAQMLERNKQPIFDALHPWGTAKSVAVHDIDMVWKYGIDTNKQDDLLEFSVRFTLYWEGPVTIDGYTKLTMTCDMESQRWRAPQMLSTNGVTNNDALELLGKLLMGAAAAF